MLYWDPVAQLTKRLLHANPGGVAFCHVPRRVALIRSFCGPYGTSSRAAVLGWLQLSPSLLFFFKKKPIKSSQFMGGSTRLAIVGRLACSIFWQLVTTVPSGRKANAHKNP